MGYTHYWYCKPQLDDEQFNKFADDALKLCIYGVEHLGFKLKFDCNEYHVILNGVGKEQGDNLKIKKIILITNYKPNEPRIFNYCKTYFYKYDTIVVSILIALKHYFPETIVKSDGGEKGIIIGKNICETVLGYGNDFELGKN